jgi:hypothetical protein
MSTYSILQEIGLFAITIETPSPFPDIEVTHIDEEEEEEEEPESYTWWELLLLRAADFIVEKIVRPAIENATWLINFIRAELRYWTYRGMQELAEFTETTEGMIVTLGVVILGAILMPEIVAKIASSEIGQLVRKLIDWTTERVGRILETVHIIDLAAIHEALLFLWPTWREIFVPFQNAVSGLAEVLGQGSGYIHSWLSAAHSLSMVGTSLLNLDPEVGEIRAMEISQEFMGRIDEKLHRYAHDPGLIFRDIVERVYIPYAEEIRNTHTATIDSIRDTREYTLTLNGRLRDLRDSFQSIVDNTVPELQEQMAANFTGILRNIDAVTSWIEGSLIPPINESIRILEDRADVLEQSNAVARAKLDNPIEIFMATEFQDQATQLATFQYIERMVTAANQGKEATAHRITAQAALTATQEVARIFMETTGQQYMKYEIPSGTVPPITPKSKIPSWNVGEY